MKKSVFNIIYVIHSGEELKESQKTLDSLADGKWNQRFSVKVQIYDACMTEETKDFSASYRKKYPENVQCFERKGARVSACFNEGLENSVGADWVNLMKDTASYDGKGLLDLTQEELEGETMISFIPYQDRNEKKISQLLFGLKRVYDPGKYRVDLEAEPYYHNLCIESLFIKRDLIGERRIRENISHEEEMFFLAELFEQTKGYLLLGKECLLREFLPSDPYNYKAVFEKDWYLPAVREELVPFAQEVRGSFIRQAILMHQVENKFLANHNEKNKTILTEQEKETFYQDVRELLGHIDDDVISQYRWTHKPVLQSFMGMNFLRLKYQDYKMVGHIKETEEGNLIVCGENQTVVESFEKAHLDVLAMNYEKGFLVIDGEVARIYYADYQNLKFYADCQGEIIPAKRTEVYSYTKYFGSPVKKGYTVQIAIPERLLKEGMKIQLVVEYEGKKNACVCYFTKIQARIRGLYQNSYWRFGDHLVKYQHRPPCLCIADASRWNKIKYELKFLKELKEYRAVAFRLLYYLTKPVYGKRNIWITFDQLFKGGDNGEYFFRYVRENHSKEVDMYYIANETSKEYRELKGKYGNVLKFGSLRLRLMALHAKVIFATRVDVRQYCGFARGSEKYLRDLFNGEIVCLQHGLTIQKIAQYQNRLFDNLKYYFCVSPYEMDNIRKPIYGFTEDMMKLTGAPRYDGLVGAPKKQILVTPTWRRNVTAGTNKKGSTHEYSVNFKHTAYFKIYNNLINDERLIACAKETGYKLIYLIHPILSPQVGDFERNEYVEIRPGTDVNYEEILKESGLMVTDYSGIQFDFAYMRRPLIYYHPEELPPQYDEGNLKYDTMGFGPVCKNNHEIVDALCRFMRQDCRLDEKYRQRIEDFFPFHDQDNCRRVYEAAVEFQKKRN